MTSTNKTIHVAHEWMGKGFDFGSCADRLTVTDAGPHFLYRQHGRTKISAEPLAYVQIDANDGVWRGAARCNDLRRAGVAMAWRHLSPPRAVASGVVSNNVGQVT